MKDLISPERRPQTPGIVERNDQFLDKLSGDFRNKANSVLAKLKEDYVITDENGAETYLTVKTG